MDARHTSKDYLEKKNHKNSLFDCAVNEQHNLSERKWLNLSERYRSARSRIRGMRSSWLMDYASLRRSTQNSARTMHAGISP